MSEVIVKQGQLEKEGGGAITRWQARWFVLTHTELTWFKIEDMRSPQGKIVLGEISDVKRVLGDRSGRKNLLTVSTGRKSYQLAAASKEEQTDWITALHPSTQASFRAKHSQPSKGETAMQGEEEDEVLAAVKAAAKQMTGVDNSRRRSSILIPIRRSMTEDSTDSDLAVAPSQPSEDRVLSPVSGPGDTTGSTASASDTKHVVVEVFIAHGLRISGPVTNQMLNMFGQDVPSSRKKLDGRGWFCDRSFTLCSVIQMFVTNGWTLYRLSHSSSSTPWEPTQQHAVNLAVFVRGPGIRPLCMTESETRVFISDADTAEQGARANPATRASMASTTSVMECATGLTPSEEAELRGLMTEFNIPLQLLQVESVG